MLHARCRILDFDVRESVRTALVADQQRVALRVVARTSGVLQDLHHAAVRVLSMPG